MLARSAHVQLHCQYESAMTLHSNLKQKQWTMQRYCGRNWCEHKEERKNLGQRKKSYQIKSEIWTWKFFFSQGEGILAKLLYQPCLEARSRICDGNRIQASSQGNYHGEATLLHTVHAVIHNEAVSECTCTVHIHVIT